MSNLKGPKVQYKILPRISPISFKNLVFFLLYTEVISKYIVTDEVVCKRDSSVTPIIFLNYLC